MTEKDRKSRLMNWPARQAFVALLASTAMLTLVAISCTEVVVVTVEVEVTREVPVTRIVEVTRVVEAITRQTRDTVGTEAAVEACSGIVGLMLRLVGSFDPSTGQPTMTVEEAGRGWFPIIANVYDSGDEDLIFAINKMIAPSPDITASEIEAIFIEIISQCSRYVQW